MVDNLNQTSNNMDQIRQIIFGEQMQEYEKKFNKMLQEIELLKREMENSISKLEKFIEKKDAESKKATHEVTDMIDNSKREFKKLLNDLQKKVDKIMDSKTDRAKLSDLFSEISQRLNESENS
ncbi:MAG: hypothetical protein KAS18_06335 [Calditrichia bacterium]|nr:hypothetical protein [Calditrichia bacterium]